MKQQPVKGVDLFRSLADELKLPLIQIARTAEQGELVDPQTSLRTIEVTASQALKLVDSYLLTTTDQQQLAIEPVSVTAMLFDVAEELSSLSKLYNAKLEIKVQGATKQVMADRRALKAALMSLAYTFITTGQRSRKQVVTLFVRTRQKRTTTAVLSNNLQLSSDDWQKAQRLHGRALEPAGSITQNSGVGLYLADSLLSAMNCPLETIKINRRTGLATHLFTSQQLVLL